MTSTGRSTALSLLSFCQLAWMIPAILKFSNNPSVIVVVFSGVSNEVSCSDLDLIQKYQSPLFTEIMI